MAAMPRPVRQFVQGAIRSSYLDWGGSGPPLVLLHGLTVSAETWTLVARLLADRFHMYALDIRGHGESDKPGQGYDYESLSQDLETFFAQSGIERAGVAGHSSGASVALRFAIRFPHRVSGLMLMDGGYGRRRERARPATREAWEPMLAPLEIYATRASYLKAASEGLEDIYSQDIEDILMASVRTNPDGSISEKLSRDHHVLILQTEWDDRLDDAFLQVQCPTLLMPSRRPGAADANARREASVGAALTELAHGRVSWIDSVHDMQLQRPDEVARVLADFLGGEVLT